MKDRERSFQQHSSRRCPNDDNNLAESRTVPCSDDSPNVNNLAANELEEHEKGDLESFIPKSKI